MSPGAASRNVCGTREQQMRLGVVTAKDQLTVATMRQKAGAAAVGLQPLLPPSGAAVSRGCMPPPRPVSPRGRRGQALARGLRRAPRAWRAPPFPCIKGALWGRPWPPFPGPPGSPFLAPSGPVFGRTVAQVLGPFFGAGIRHQKQGPRIQFLSCGVRFLGPDSGPKKRTPKWPKNGAQATTMWRVLGWYKGRILGGGHGASAWHVCAHHASRCERLACCPAQACYMG